jgi:hypothetical protein
MHCFELEIFVNELCGLAIVGHDASDSRCRDKDHFGLLLRKESADRPRVKQIQIRVCPADQVGKTEPLQIIPDGTTYQSTVTSDVRPGLSIQFHARHDIDD